MARTLTPTHKQAMAEGKKRKSRGDRKAKIRGILASESGKECNCGFHEDMTDEEIRAIFPDTCCKGRWICPTADRMNRLILIPNQKTDDD